MYTAYVIVPVADVYKNHTFTSEVVTQALMYEKVTILDTHDNWSRVEQWDGYQGWINNFYIRIDLNLQETEIHYVFNRKKTLDVWWHNDDSWILKNSKLEKIQGWKPEIAKPQRKIRATIPYGVKIPYILESDNSEFLIPRFFKAKFDCYNLATDIPKEFDWVVYSTGNNPKYKYKYNAKEKGVEYAEEQLRLGIWYDLQNLISSPYKWGGKTSFGFDCSGLVQTVFRANGLSIPRDSKDQYKIVKNNMISDSVSKNGDLLFFEENKKICHVGVIINTTIEGLHPMNRFIHCSGMVKENCLDRSHDPGLFDSELMDKFVGIFSISKIIKEQLNE